MISLENEILRRKTLLEKAERGLNEIAELENKIEAVRKDISTIDVEKLKGEIEILQKFITEAAPVAEASVEKKEVETPVEAPVKEEEEVKKEIPSAIIGVVETTTKTEPVKVIATPRVIKVDPMFASRDELLR